MAPISARLPQVARSIDRSNASATAGTARADLRQIEVQCDTFEKGTPARPQRRGEDSFGGQTTRASSVTEGRDLAGDVAQYSGIGLGTIANVLGKTLGQPLAGALGILGGTAGVISGGVRIAQALDNPNTEEAALQLLDATAETIGGACNLAGPAGRICSLPALAFRGGLAIGSAGDEAVRERGWLQDEQGNNESASDRLARHGDNTRRDVENATGSPVLGHIAGVADMALELIPAAATAVAGFVSEIFEGDGRPAAPPVPRGHNPHGPTNANYYYTTSGQPLAY